MMDDIDRTFDWWSAALKGERGPISADEPRAGFYRSKSKDKTLSAVAIWYDSNTGELRYQDNGRDVDEMKARERWPYVSKNPISEVAFWQFRETGVWSDIDGAAHGTPPEGAPSEGDPVLTIAAKITAAKQNLANYLKIESDEQSTKAQSLRALLTTLKGEVVKSHKAEKEPHLEAGREVDRKWFPLRDEAEASAVQLRTAIEDWELAKRKAAQAAEVRGVASNMPAPAARISGGMGRTASAKPYLAVVEIDVEKVFQQFKTSAEVHDLLTKLSQQSVDAGISVPGAKTEERIRVR